MIIQVNESSQTGETRRKALEYAEGLELGATRCGAVALAATEMATNLVKHAGRGNMLIQHVRENGHSGLRVLRCRMDIRLLDQWERDWALSDVSRMSLRFTPPTAQGPWYAPNFGK
jgi:anti-sigma regulatory factor (Ser/Thr protein kinase)